MWVPGLVTWLGVSLLWGLVDSDSFKRVCYFTNWSGDLLIPDAYFTLADLDPRLCSHLMYAFAKIHTDSLELLPTRPDDEEGENGELGRYIQFNNLKNNYTHLTTMLSVGGSLQANTGFAKVVESGDNRRKFARQCVEFLRRWNFDGIDVDWEYPGNPPETRTNFTMLLLELRQEIEREASASGEQRLVLSMAAPVSEDLITLGYEIDKVSTIVDFINLMAYDFHGAWNRISGFNAPLYPREGDWRFRPDLNVQWAVDKWLTRGAPAEKLVVGIAGYGASYTLADPAVNAVGSAVEGPGIPGPYRVMEGQLAFYEICELIEKEGGTYVWDDKQKVPYVYTNDTWVGFDDERSVAVKTEWMIERNLGGAMLWCLDLDDFKGTHCNRGRFPLLRSITRTAAKYFDHIDLPPTRPTVTTTTSTTTTTTTTTITTTTTTTTTTALPTTIPTTTRLASTTSTTSTTTTTTTTTTTIPATSATTTSTIATTPSTRITSLPTTVATTTTSTTTTTTTRPTTLPTIPSTTKTTRGNMLFPTTSLPSTTTNRWGGNNDPMGGNKNRDDDDNDGDHYDDDDEESQNGNDIDAFGNEVFRGNGIETNAASKGRTRANGGFTSGCTPLRTTFFTCISAIIVIFAL